MVYAIVDEPFIDPDNDADVDLFDFSYFANNWLRYDCEGPQWCGGTDLNQNGLVDLFDLYIIVELWLAADDIDEFNEDNNVRGVRIR
jgi:hypothetical protein